jgi:hypothetical protein
VCSMVKHGCWTQTPNYFSIDHIQRKMKYVLPELDGGTGGRAAKHSTSCVPTDHHHRTNPICIKSYTHKWWWYTHIHITDV